MLDKKRYYYYWIGLIKNYFKFNSSIDKDTFYSIQKFIELCFEKDLELIKEKHEQFIKDCKKENGNFQ